MPSTVTDVIDGISSSVAVKAPVRTAVATNLTLYGLQTVAGIQGSIALVDGDRVLAYGQTIQSARGIYVVRATAWERAKDFDGGRDATSGTRVFVGGTSIGYRLDTANPITIGTTSLTFTQLGEGGGAESSIIYPLLPGEVGVTNLYFPYGDVRRHGAVGDSDYATASGTDDLDAIQNALDSWPHVYGQPGVVYLVDTTAPVDPDTGGPLNPTVARTIENLGLVLAADSNQAIMKVQGVSGLTVRRCIFDGNRANQTDIHSDQNFLVIFDPTEDLGGNEDLEQFSDVHFEQCEVRNSRAVGVGMRGAVRSSITDCYVHDNYHHGIVAAGGYQPSQNAADSPSEDTRTRAACAHIKITENVVVNSGGGGIVAMGATIYAVISDNIVVDWNYIEFSAGAGQNQGGDAITCYNRDNLGYTISGNLCIVTQLPEGDDDFISYEAATISAAAADNSFNDSAGGFLTAGFEVGMPIVVTGFTGDTDNNLSAGGSIITSLTANKMIIGGDNGDVIVNDAAGEDVTISSPGQFISQSINGHGIHAGGIGTTITGNVIIGTVNSGIRIQAHKFTEVEATNDTNANTSDITIIGNTIVDNTPNNKNEAGILCTAVTGLIIEGNNVTDSVDDAIWLQDCQSFTVQNNIARNPGGHGIALRQTFPQPTALDTGEDYNAGAVVRNGATKYRAYEDDLLGSAFAADLALGKWKVANWVTGTNYVVDDVVQIGVYRYTALNAHTAAAAFATDYDGGEWELLGDDDARGTITGNVITLPGGDGIHMDRAVQVHTTNNTIAESEVAAAWVTATVYDEGDMVVSGGLTYVCIEAHTSGVFATDLAATKWVLRPALAALYTGPYASAITGGRNAIRNSGTGARLVYFDAAAVGIRWEPDIVSDGTVFRDVGAEAVAGTLSLARQDKLFVVSGPDNDGPITDITGYHHGRQVRLVFTPGSVDTEINDSSVDLLTGITLRYGVFTASADRSWIDLLYIDDDPIDDPGVNGRWIEMARGFDAGLAGVALPTYADEAAAVTGGIATGTFYKTATGELRVKL